MQHERIVNFKISFFTARPGFWCVGGNFFTALQKEKFIVWKLLLFIGGPELERIIILFIVKEKDICLFTYNYLRTWPVQKLKSVGCEGQECGKCLRLRFPPAMRAEYLTLNLNFGWLVSIFKTFIAFERHLVSTNLKILLIERTHRTSQNRGSPAQNPGTKIS